jgi:hypothetical protein
MLNILVAGAAALSLFSPLAAPWDDGANPPPTDRIVIDVVTVNGTGCRPGTAAVAVAPDNTAFTVTYSEYLTQAGYGTKPTDGRKNCQLNLRVHVPQGFTYAIASAQYRGFKHVEKGATGLQKANYYFQGDALTGTKEHPIKAGEADWQFNDEVGVDALVWSKCGAERNLNINTELRVSAGTSDKKSTSFINMDSTDAAINTIYHFAWEKCPKN